MAKPPEVNPFAQFIQTPQAAENPFAQFLIPPEPTLSPEEQMMGAIGQTSPGYNVLTATKDIGKLVGAGAVTGSFGAPEAIEAGAQETAKSTMFAPSTALEYIADPIKLANKMYGAFNLAPVQEQQNIIPPKFNESQRLAVDEVLAKGKIPQLRKLTDIGENISNSIRDTVSDDMKLAMAESQPTGNILKAFQTGDFSEISKGPNPSFMGYAGHAANVFGTALPAFLTAAVTKNLGPTAAVGFGQAGSEAVGEAREHIKKMSDEQLTKNSPYFANLIVLGYDPKTARQMTEAKAGDTAAMYQGVVGALGSAFTSKLIHGAFDKTLLASAKSRLGKIVAGTLVGAGEGAVTEFAEGVAADLGINTAVVREIGVDSFANLVLGALGEGAPGVLAGVKAPVEGQAPQASPQVPTAAPETPSLMERLKSNLGTDIEKAKELLNKVSGKETEIEPTTPLAQGLDPEMAQRIKMRIDQIDTAQVPLAGRTVNPLAKDLGLFVPKGQRPEQTYIQIKEALGLPTEPVAPTEAAVPETEVEAPEEQAIPPAAQPITQQPNVGFKEAFEGSAKGISDNFYKTAFDAIQSGKNKMSGVAEPILQKAKPYFEAGLLPSADMLRYYEENGYPELPVSVAPKAEEVVTPPAAEAPAKPVVESPIQPEQLQPIIDALKQTPRVNPNEISYLEMAQQEIKNGNVDTALNRLKNMVGLSVEGGDWATYSRPDLKALLEPIATTPTEQEKKAYQEQQAQERKKAEQEYQANLPKSKAEIEKEEKIAANKARQEEKKAADAEAKAKKAPTVVEMPEKEAEKSAVKVTENKIFTEDAATKARNRLRSKLNQFNSGIDPEFLVDGVTLSGYHIEKGARTFAAYAKAMIEDLGDKVIPYLKSWYMGVKFDPRAAEFMKEMDDEKTIDSFSFDKEESIFDPDTKFKIAEDIAQHFAFGNSFKDIVEARKFIAEKTGKKIEPGTAEAKEADEAIEVGVVLAARKIINKGRSDSETYDGLVNLYNQQPNLNVRSSTSVREQAYSTPAPLAYVASKLAGINKDSTVYEPTAGNGMLLIDSNYNNVTVNELNASRYEMLKRLFPKAEITNENALEVTPSKKYDTLIANPPFGAIGERIDIDGFNTREIDHAIAYKSLADLKNDGNAVLIVGGVMGEGEKRREGYRSSQKRNFYFKLYENYNVVDHFTVAGDMYKKQGAAYPVDVIVIKGKGKSDRKLPAADLPQVISSYEQLKGKLDEANRMASKPVSTTRADSGTATTGSGEPQGVGSGAVKPSERPSDEGAKSTESGKRGVSTSESTERGRAEPTGGEPSRGESKPVDVSEPSGVGRQPVPESGREARGEEGTGRGEPGAVGGTGSGTSKRVESKLKDRAGLETETENQVTYNPRSQASSVGTLAPKAMAQAIEESLQKVEDEVGNIDEYVADKINMDIETLRDNFSAEQVDALALSIRNAEAGKGFIIGDQTGIGKGRVVAAMIRYALVNGKVPIFVTEKPNLYSDMIRDLDDIGMATELSLDTAKPKIFITNSSEAIPYQLIREKDGEIVEEDFNLKAPKSGAALDEIMKKLREDEKLGNYKVIFTTYSQLQTVKGKETERQRFIRDFGLNNYMIFDESHNAGGGGETQARSKEQRDAAKEGKGLSTGRAAFVRELVNNAFGTFFSSATYAKRPDVMDLYSSTDMSLAVDTPSELGAAIKHGGVPMQQIVATMLTKVGQYIRRERTFAGVSYNTVDTKVDKETAENMAYAMRNILAFSREKEKAVKEMQKSFDESGSMAGGAGESVTVQSANFGSIMHNLIDQMLLSLKSQSSVDHAIERLKAGEKVVMTVSNTMGSFLQSYAEEMDIKVGGKVDLTFKDLYVRYLEKQRVIKIKSPNGTKEYRLTDEDLGPTLTAQYELILNQIEEAGFGSAPISPIDYMHNALRKAGYKTDEITGRTNTLDYSSGTPLLASRSANIKQRVKAVRGFNSGETDVIILNQAGSTGLSLHASNKFKDQRKRHMVIVQPEKNIDTHMQMLGRVHRTGQVVAPAYSQMMADIPAEMRPAAVLLKKMASLNANTTASRKSSVTAEGVVDFMNDYGGQIAQEYLKDNPEIYEALGGSKIIKLTDDVDEQSEEDIRKFTGYIPILPIKQQEEVYADLIERYNELLERENSMGTNKLEAKAVDLNAETLSSKAFTEDKGEDSLFARPAYMEQVEVKRTVKPYTKAELVEIAKENLDGKQAAQANEDMARDLTERFKPYYDERVKKAEEDKSDPVKTEALRGQLNIGYNHIKTILDTYRVGQSVILKDANGVPFYGVIIGISNNKRTANPAAGSDWKMQIGIANGDSKSLTFSFSQLGNRYNLERASYGNVFNYESQKFEETPIIDMFDRGANERTEKRWMVTGNILAGFAQYPGQIMTYTKKDGGTGQGVLMPRTFDFAKAEKEAAVKLKTADDAMRFLTEIGGEMGTKDSSLRIFGKGNQFVFYTPASKKVGGTFFLDPQLTNALGQDFYKRGSDMTVYVYDQAKAKAAIDYLINGRQETLVALTRTDKAREMFAPTPPVKSMSPISNQNENREIVAQKVNSMKEKAKYSPTGLKADELVSWANNARNIGSISDEVFNVIDYLAKKAPNVLDGLKLQIRPESLNPNSNYETAGEMIGNIVALYAGTKGVTNPATIRHELTHALEMAMNKEAKEKLVGDWRKKLDAQEAAEKTDQGQQFFKAVRAFLAMPSEGRFEDAVRAIPEGQYEKYYQLISPSEFWAINAEPMMKAFLGGAWKRFQNFVKGLFEALKNVVGMDNKNDIHRLFNDVINKPKISKETLNDYIKATAPKKSITPKDPSNINDLLVKHKRNHTPVNPDPSTLDKMMGMADLNKIRNMTLKDGVLAVPKMVGQVDRAITYVQNKNIWYGKGLEQADIERYKGQLRDGNNRAVASVAVTNAIHAGHIGTRVLTQGSLVFDPVFQMFKAQKSKFSMANVIDAKAKLAKRIGLQEATDVINQYLEAKRSKSIINEYLARQQTYQDALDSGEEVELAAKQLKDIERAFQKISMSDEAIEDFGALNKEHPELNTIMENWTKVNHNQLDMQLFSGLISKARHKQLKGIQDYVPWQRIMDDMEDLHTQTLRKNVRGLTNVAQPKAFQKGKTNRQVDDILHNMIVNVVNMSRNSARNYAANRVAQEYATRNQRNRIKVFPKEGVMSDGSVRTNIVMNGRRVIVEFKDPLIAEAVLGMETIDIPMMDALAFIANGLRRSVTINPIFQVKQMFMDAPTAAIVSGVKNPQLVWADTFNGFFQSLRPSDPIVNMMKDFGIGGYQSSARSPEKELKLEIGIINHSKLDWLTKQLDRVGDASDYAQRRSIYKRVMKEKGDPLQAMLQANNVIDFLKRGSAQHAQFLSRNVSFMNAYAQQINVLAEALTLGGLKGNTKAHLVQALITSAALLATTTLLYAWAVGDDDEYNQLDDQTKMRNYFIPKSVLGKSYLIPMNTSAAYFFKAVPEMIFNKIKKEGTKNHIDWTRLGKALKDGAYDALLGPNPIPTAIKPGIEIMFNHNFLTGGSITPRSLQGLEAFRQYTADTSELGKMISKVTGGALNPIEADHFIRSLTGTVGAAVMWGSNMFSGERVTPEDRKNPLYGAFVAREVPRGREDLYYDLAERANEKYNTFMSLNKPLHAAEAKKYFQENKGLITAHGYTSAIESNLKKVNAEIRRTSDLPSSEMSSDAKRERMTQLQNIKNNMLKDVIEMRKKAGL
jgi:hypothetical protein